MTREDLEHQAWEVGVSITDPADLHADVKPLTNREIAWLIRLQRALAACPSKRLTLVSGGDAMLLVTDDIVRKAIDASEHDGHASRSGILLADILGGPTVHNVSW